MSSRRLYEFRCSSNHISEVLAYPETHEVLCRECGDPAQRIISPVRSHLEGISGAFPTAADRWARVHEQAAAVATARKRRHEEP